VLPLAMPAYVMAYTYTDLLQFVGPVQTWRCARPSAGSGRLLVPRRAQHLGGAVVMFSLVLYPYVYLLARTAFLERAGGMLEVARSLGLALAGLLARVLPLARPAIAAGVALALMETLADYGTVSLLRGADLHHRHLPRLVLAGRPGCRRAAGAGAAGLRDHRAGASSASAAAAALTRHQPARGGSAPALLHRQAALLAWCACAMPLVGFVLPAACCCCTWR
jgi:iron(III) transport system permease protein